MIAILSSSGAFLYNITEKEANERIAVDRELSKTRFMSYKELGKGGLDFDEKGSRRKTDGMCGWLYMHKDITKWLAQLGCEAVYVQKDIGSYTEFILVKELGMAMKKFLFRE